MKIHRFLCVVAIAALGVIAPLHKVGAVAVGQSCNQLGATQVSDDHRVRSSSASRRSVGFFEEEPPDFLRLRAFFAWCCIFAVFGLLALSHGIKRLHCTVCAAMRKVA